MAATSPGAGSTRSTDGQTRRDIMSAMLTARSVTASELAEKVGVSPAGVRRHLDKLLEDDLIEVCAEPKTRAGGAGATRGRPAKHYQLTAAGRDRFGSGYDDLALAAFAEVEAIGGREAVKNLARKRAEKLLGEVAAEGGVDKRTREVAAAFAAHGYAANADNVGSSLQLCQHHCPVHAVAAEYPEICEAEHELIAELVGSAISPLAKIANGDGVCTTHISLADHAGGTHMERSGEDD